jgi:hypothetical protein
MVFAMSDSLILTKDDLFVEFDDSDMVILNALFSRKYTGFCPKCNWHKPFVKTPKKRSFHCTRCSYQIFPCAGTIFEKSLIPLGWWLLLIFELMQDNDLSIDDFMWNWLRYEGKFIIKKASIQRIYPIVLNNIKGDYIVVSKHSQNEK